MKKFLVCVVFAGAMVGLGRPVSAQSRPLLTQDPETVPPGDILFETGVEHDQAAFYPASGLKGNLWRVGTFGLSFGVSSIAEIQLDGGVHDYLSITSRDPAAPLAFMLTVPPTTMTTRDFEDLTVGAKIRFATETASRPSLAVRFWTRLPNANNETGLGLDTTDFHFNLLLGKTVQSVRIVGNFGFGILSDPVRGDRQNDVMDYGASVARAVRPGVEVVGEINGRLNTRNGVPPIGTESRSLMRLGARYTHGAVRVDGAVILGVTTFDPNWGFTGGMTWVFKAFNVK